MIAKMVRYDFVLLRGQSDGFIDRLREAGLVDITATGWEPTEEDRLRLQEIEGRAKAIDSLSAFAESESCDKTAEPYATGREAYESWRSATQQAAALQQEIARLEKSAEELRPWGRFSGRVIAELAGQGVSLRLFTASAGDWEQYRDEWSARWNVEEISQQAGMVYFVAIARPGDEIAIDAQEVKLPPMDAADAEKRAQEAAAELKQLDALFSRAARSLDRIRDDHAALSEALQNIRITATAGTAAEGSLLLMEGWAEAETSDKVDRLVEEYPDVVYLKRRPVPEDDTPVKLKNGWFSRIFEMVGDMYARPKYGTIDLTPFFAPFYMLFFGICLNDAGYGLVLLLAGAWMLSKYREKGMMRRAAWFATMCALSTTLFGLFCGSFFGINLATVFPSIPFFDFQNRFFSWALAIGMVQILFGMAINVWGLTRAFGFQYALGALGWLIILLAASVAGGLPMLNEAWVIEGFTTSSPAFYAALGVGGVLLLLLNTPGKFLNPLVNIGSGLWTLYNNITGLLSDVLSYIRLFAIGLSGGVLALVFNSLADGFVPEGANIAVRILIMLPILLIGHGINLFMSTISSFVHPMRLTFVEFYKNAGFEMASRNFEPLQKENTNK